MNGQTSQFISFYEVSEKVMRLIVFTGTVVAITMGIDMFLSFSQVLVKGHIPSSDFEPSLPSLHPI